jgi:hypothetical protein
MALAGDHVVVKMNNNQFAAGDITSVDLGMTYDQHDVTGFGDAVHRVINGQLQAPVTLKGFLTTTATIGTHTVIGAAFAAGSQVTLEVQVGQNAPPTTNDPKYRGEFFIESYKPVMETGGAVKFEATLKPAVGSGTDMPQWGVV